MTTVQWTIQRIPLTSYNLLRRFVSKWRLAIHSLTYNHFMDQSYVADVCMEPLFWFVDNFTCAIGPIFVAGVIILTFSVVAIAYWIGLPYWWQRNSYVCVLMVIVGHWILINICFHYYMAVVTPPGYPPQGELIAEAVSICKKCISPKPPRTHHCSVCNRCILKMDHHCPWLNNCVGYRNHRYFFLYMCYMVIGVFFIIVCGFDIAYTAIMLSQTSEEPELVGHTVKINRTGAIIPVTDRQYLDSTLFSEEQTYEFVITPLRRKAIIYMTVINSGVFVALGMLTVWHSRLIRHGETSIEANINKSEMVRLAECGKEYRNPYDFGTNKNWNVFLGLVQGRTFFRHVVLPSGHEPIGDGLTWYTVNDDDVDKWP